jgi:hypothetical protein
MPWATLKARPKLEMEVIPDNGHRYVVTWFAGEAYLPLHIYNYLIRQGLIERGDKPDPRPKFERWRVATFMARRSVHFPSTFVR